MGKVRILWVSAVSLVVVGVVGALVTLAVLSGNSYEDTTPPIISDISIHHISENTAQVSWTTNEPATTEIRCSAEDGGIDSVIVGPGGHQNLSTSHTVFITGLQPSTRYAIRLISADAAGNEAVSGKFTFTTPLSIPPYRTWGYPPSSPS